MYDALALLILHYHYTLGAYLSCLVHRRSVWSFRLPPSLALWPLIHHHAYGSESVERGSGGRAALNVLFSFQSRCTLSFSTCRISRFLCSDYVGYSSSTFLSLSTSFCPLLRSSDGFVLVCSDSTEKSVRTHVPSAFAPSRRTLHRILASASVPLPLSSVSLHLHRKCFAFEPWDHHSLCEASLSPRLSFLFSSRAMAFEFSLPTSVVFLSLTLLSAALRFVHPFVLAGKGSGHLHDRGCSRRFVYSGKLGRQFSLPCNQVLINLFNLT